MEKLILQEIIVDIDLFPSHYFGFRKKHSTIQQCDRIVDVIIKAKEFWSAVFLEESQTIDKVGRECLLHKINNLLPNKFNKLFKLYLDNKAFIAKIGQNCSKICFMKAGVPEISSVHQISRY